MTPNPGADSRRVLVLFAHPAMHKSRVNRVLADGLGGVPGITFRDLYQHYPDLDIDVAEEQSLLTDHDAVVFQHPFFWYSTPAMLKEWQDLVLEHGWAYGREGTKLHGKILLPAVTAGGKEESYRPEGFNRMTVRQLLSPVEQTARLCGMRFIAPFVVHGTHAMQPERIREHAADYLRVLTALRDGTLDVDAAASPDLPFLNRDLAALIRETV